MSGTIIPAPWTGLNFDPPTDTDISTAQMHIVQRIKRFMPDGAAVEPFPDRGPKYRNLNQRSVVLVRWDGARYEDLHTTNFVDQDVHAMWALIVGARSLGRDYGQTGELGAYSLIERVRLALQGYRLPGYMQALRGVTETYREDQEGTVWWYECIYQTKVAKVQRYETPNFPLFIEGRALEKGGITDKAIAALPFTFDSIDQINLDAQNVSGLVITNQNQTMIYLLNVDYTLDSVNGIITRLPGGAIVALATVLVGFNEADVVTALVGTTVPES